MDIWPFSMFGVQRDIILISAFNVEKKSWRIIKELSLVTLIFFLVQCECFSMNIWSGNFWAKRRGSRPKRAQNSYKPPIKIFIHLSIKEILGSILKKNSRRPYPPNDNFCAKFKWSSYAIHQSICLEEYIKGIPFFCKKSSYHLLSL